MVDYFRYCSPAPLQKDWGVCVTGAGVCQTPPGSPYPPRVHPEDHHLDWHSGRILKALQIVLITAGRGSIETRTLRKRRVSAGTAILVLPGMWHRYRPNPQTGWSESWVEIQSKAITTLMDSAQLSPRSILCHDVLKSGLNDCLDAIHRRLHAEEHSSDLEVSGLALQALSICMRGTTARLSRNERAVRLAEQHFARQPEKPINVEQLAAELGIEYSHFCDEFRQFTAMTPWEYVTHLRLKQARRLLISSEARLEEVAKLAGFCSTDQLCHEFQKEYGYSPSVWRQQVRATN